MTIFWSTYRCCRAVVICSGYHCLFLCYQVPKKTREDTSKWGSMYMDDSSAREKERPASSEINFRGACVWSPWRVLLSILPLGRPLSCKILVISMKDLVLYADTRWGKHGRLAVPDARGPWFRTAKLFWLAGGIGDVVYMHWVDCLRGNTCSGDGKLNGD